MISLKSNWTRKIIHSCVIFKPINFVTTKNTIRIVLQYSVVFPRTKFHKKILSYINCLIVLSVSLFFIYLLNSNWWWRSLEKKSKKKEIIESKPFKIGLEKRKTNKKIIVSKPFKIGLVYPRFQIDGEPPTGFQQEWFKLRHLFEVSLASM